MPANVNIDMKGYLSRHIDEDYMLNKFKPSIITSNTVNVYLNHNVVDISPVFDNEFITCYLYYRYKDDYIRITKECDKFTKDSITKTIPNLLREIEKANIKERISMEKLLREEELSEIKILIDYTNFLKNVNEYFKGYFSSRIGDKYMLNKFKFSKLSSDEEYNLNKFKFSVAYTDIISKFHNNKSLINSEDTVNKIITCYLYYNHDDVYKRLKDINDRNLEFNNIKKNIPNIGPLKDKIKLFENRYEKIKRLVSDNSYEWYFSTSIDGCDSLRMINNINPSYPFSNSIFDNMIPFKSNEISEPNEYIGSIINNKVNYFLKKVENVTVSEDTGDIEFLLHINDTDCRYNEPGGYDSIINSINIMSRNIRTGELELLYKYNFKNEKFRHGDNKSLNIYVKLEE